MSKKNNKDTNWISLSPDVKKLRDRWLEMSKTNLPMVILGDTGTGKSFWIEQSIRERFQADRYKLIKVDYSQKKDLFDISINLLSKNKQVVIWWENLSEAPIEEVRLWLQWWKDTKYSLPEDSYLYWEINSVEIEQLKESKIHLELFEQFTAFQFYLSPLHRRVSDLPYFVLQFLSHANADLKKSVISFDEQFHHFFSKRHFKHNLHELKDLVYSLVAYSPKKNIKFANIPVHFFENVSEDLHIKPGVKLEVYEKEIIKANLKYSNGNRVKTAKLLGISERNLYRKIKGYELDATE